MSTLSNGRIAWSLKELARQALVMVLEMNRKLRGDRLQCPSHNHAQLNRVSVMTSLQKNRVMQTWRILTVTGGDPESRLGRKEKQRESGSMSLVAKKAMNRWRLKRNGCEFTVVPDEICSLPVTLRADQSLVTFRRDVSP